MSNVLTTYVIIHRDRNGNLIYEPDTFKSLNEINHPSITLVVNGNGSHIFNETVSLNYQDLIVFKDMKNLGYVRNHCILHGDSKWITFVDGDDEVTQDYFYLIDKWIDEDTYKTMIRFSYIWKSKDGEEILPTVDHYKGSLATKDYLPNVSYVMNREFLLKNKLFFPDDLELGEDILWSYRVHMTVKKMKIKRDAIYIYRNDKSVMSTNQRENMSDKFQHHSNVIKYLLTSSYPKLTEYEY